VFPIQFFPSQPSNISALNFVKRDKLFFEGVPHEDNKNTACKQSKLEIAIVQWKADVKHHKILTDSFFAFSIFIKII